MARTRKKWQWGGYLGVTLLLGMGLLQGQLGFRGGATAGSTVTPLPAPVATMTKAAQKIQQAQSAKEDAARKAREAQQAAADADAAFNAAQQESNDARALLASQQSAAASEALGRAEELISAGQTRVDDLVKTINQMSATIGQQADQISTLTADLQQSEASQQTTLAAYMATKSELDRVQSGFTVSPLVAVLAGAFLLAAVLVFVAGKWNSVPRDKPQVVSGHYTTRPADADDDDSESIDA